MMALYHNEGTGCSSTKRRRSTIGQASLLTLTFACFFFDYDLDGRPTSSPPTATSPTTSTRAAEGHLRAAAAPVPQPRQARSSRRSAQSRRALQQPAGRARRGLRRLRQRRRPRRVDHHQQRRGRLLRNDGGNKTTCCASRPSARSNRDGIGAKVTLKFADQRKLWGMVKTGSSYCSQSELPLTFGLGKADKVASVEIAWPSGRVDTLTDVAANQMIIVQEGKGQVTAQPVMFATP
jgi:hypothetical protein